MDVNYLLKNFIATSLYIITRCDIFVLSNKLTKQNINSESVAKLFSFLLLLRKSSDFSFNNKIFMAKNSISDENFRGFRKLTHEQVLWLIDNYHITTNEMCARILKLKEKTLINYAFRLNLRKSPEHISKLRKQQAINTNNKRWKK